MRCLTTNYNIRKYNRLTTPKLNTSTFGEISPRAHSGAWYPGVPYEAEMR